jgi:hypothetical protein
VETIIFFEAKRHGNNVHNAKHSGAELAVWIAFQTATFMLIFETFHALSMASMLFVLSMCSDEVKKTEEWFSRGVWRGVVLVIAIHNF